MEDDLWTDPENTKREKGGKDEKNQGSDGGGAFPSEEQGSFSEAGSVRSRSPTPSRARAGC